MLRFFKKLKQSGVLGINKRNAEYTLKYNPRRLYPLVDDKLKTKQLAKQHGIAVPELYHVVEIEREVRDLPNVLRGYSEFVMKPAHGSGGDGIVVINGRRKGMFRKASGVLLSTDELQYQASNTLSGMYSLGGQPDKVIIEALVKFDPVFTDITYLGVPDIRIIVFLGIPVMAMVRLPTRMSDGKANLHQGAIGAGINIDSGKTISGVWRNDCITDHPDTGSPIIAVTVPHWQDMLHIATKCYDMTQLGYQGVDIVLDKDKGPLMLELNARPGLNIQIANNTGLWHRLKRVEQQIDQPFQLSPEQRIHFAKDNFGAMD